MATKQPKVQGVIPHRCGSLLTPSADNTKYLQLYFTGDEERECRERCRLNKGVKPNVVLELQEMLHPYRTLVDQFKMSLGKMTGPNYSVVIRAAWSEAEWDT